MTCKVTVQKNTFSESLAIVGRSVGSHAHMPILSNVQLSKDEGHLCLSATNLTMGVTAWMDASMDGDLSLTLPAKTLADVVNSLTEPEVVFTVNGQPEAVIKCGAYKGIIKGIDAGEFPPLPNMDQSNGISLDAEIFKECIRKVAYAASADDSRPVLGGVLVTMEGNTLSCVATDGFRLAINKVSLTASLPQKQLIIPAVTLKEVARILNVVKTSHFTLFIPETGSQIGFRCENVQIVSQLVDGKYPDYWAILPKGHKTRAMIDRNELLKACKQAAIIARECNNVIHLHLLPPGSDQKGKVKIQAEADEAGASEIELEATIEGQELEIAFNVKFLQDVLEIISAGKVIIETNAHNTPAVIRPVDREEDYISVLMPMHIS